MMDNEIDGYKHLEWLERIGLHETAYFTSFYYIETGAIGFETVYDDDEPTLHEWITESVRNEWNSIRKEKRYIKRITRRHAHRFRKKDDIET